MTVAAPVRRVLWEDPSEGLVLDVDALSTANGANIHQWQWTGANNQKWRFDLR